MRKLSFAFYACVRHWSAWRRLMGPTRKRQRSGRSARCSLSAGRLHSSVKRLFAAPRSPRRSSTSRVASTARRSSGIKADAGNPAQARSEAERLAGQGIAVVFGTNSSGLAIPASQVLEQQKVIFWEPGSAADEITTRRLQVHVPHSPGGSAMGLYARRFRSRQAYACARQDRRHGQDRHQVRRWRIRQFNRQVVDRAPAGKGHHSHR